MSSLFWKLCGEMANLVGGVYIDKRNLLLVYVGVKTASVQGIY